MKYEDVIVNEYRLGLAPTRIITPKAILLCKLLRSTDRAIIMPPMAIMLLSVM